MMHPLLLETACAVTAGFLGGALFSWRVLRALRILNFRVEDLEVQVIREIKRRAANGRWSKQEELEELARATKAEPSNFWEKLKAYNPNILK